MHRMLAFFTCLLLWLSCSKRSVAAVDIYSIQNEVAGFNLTCNEDSCEYKETDSLSSRSCHCGIQCVQLGTCCVDSYYAAIPQPKLKPSCRAVYRGKSYYIVDQCPYSDSVWASLCNDEWDEDDDVQKLVPVTSLSTSITYKNYYCFKCHEASDDFLYWVLKIESEIVQAETPQYKQSNGLMSLIYNKDINTWMATYDENSAYFPVSLSLQIPFEISRLVHVCEPDVISDCPPEWSDEQIRSSCQAYMALKDVNRNGGTLKYKNIHCALCNFESLSDVSCRKIIYTIFTAKKPFSFTYLLDINRSDGEYVGKVQKCPNDHVWDPYANKCRKLTCALPGYKVKNGKCVQD